MARISCTCTFDWGRLLCTCIAEKRILCTLVEGEGWMARCIHRETMQVVHVGGPKGEEKLSGV